jgi:hypothetical protein
VKNSGVVRPYQPRILAGLRFVKSHITAGFLAGQFRHIYTTTRLNRAKPDHSHAPYFALWISLFDGVACFLRNLTQVRWKPFAPIK